jgi:hypothetical protein
MADKAASATYDPYIELFTRRTDRTATPWLKIAGELKRRKGLDFDISLTPEDGRDARNAREPLRNMQRP